MATDHEPSDAHTGTEMSRPIRDLLLTLPHLQVSPFGFELEYASAEPALVLQIESNAETVMRTIHLGLSAIGHLVAHASPEFEDKSISAEAMANLGWLVAELGDLASVCHTLSAGCKRHTADYAPRHHKRIPLVKA